jgi:ribulose-phosphate 3-epimerase
VEPFAKAGADIFCFHLEPALGVYRSRGTVEGPPRYDAIELAQRVREAGMSPGLAVNPDVPLDAALEAAPHFDLILVMSIFPGFSGQSFKPETLEITRAVRAKLRDDQRLEMDGGINPENAGPVREAGCDVLVAASAIFGREPAERPHVISALRGAKDRT